MSPDPAFAWPPKPVAEPPGKQQEPVAPARPPGPLSRAAFALRHIERYWLDPVSLPLDERARAIRWTPDPPDDYCDRCGQTLGEHESSEFGCASCAGRRFRWRRLVRLGEYAGPLAEWIREAKFHRNDRLAEDLGRRLGRLLAPTAPPGPVVLVPVPMPWFRRQRRGVDHTLAIARGLSHETGWPVVRALGARPHALQHASTGSQRPGNVAKAFRRRLPDLSGRAVVLVDDVLTTGSTLRAASRALYRPADRRPGLLVVAVVAVTADPAEGNERNTRRIPAVFHTLRGPSLPLDSQREAATFALPTRNEPRSAARGEMPRRRRYL